MAATRAWIQSTVDRASASLIGVRTPSEPRSALWAMRLDVLNTASVSVCERLGMRREAHLVDNDLDGDRWGSEYIYATLVHEWKG